MRVRTDRARRQIAALGLLALASTTLSACDTGAASPVGERPADDTGNADAGDEDDGGAPAPEVDLNVARGAEDVPVDTVLAVTVRNATLQAVRATSEDGPLPGRKADNGHSWKAGDRLEPGTAYKVVTVAQGEDGRTVRSATRFRTQDLTLDQQTYASIAPLAGETVGVGMPVIVSFDVPVTDRASFEKHMSVSSTPRQPGTWHWISDNEAHYRPKRYWKPGTEVSVDVDVNGVPAGDGIYGQHSRTVDFTVGDAHVYRVDARTHQMKVFSNGDLLRTIPITTGKAGFDTRNGTKVIIEKFDSKRMNSETVGIPAGSSEAYDIDNVQWAMRLTYSGEFIHAAPWSVGSQGNANVSHGCTGMSTADADWLYRMTRRGDVVETVGTNGDDMTLTNGYGDWNVSYAEYAKGSALG